MNNNSIDSNSIEFAPGEQVEIYFPEEKIEYRLYCSDKKYKGYEDCLIVKLPNEFKSTFYKGEDFIQCRYVDNNIVYEFGGEILRIVHGQESYVIIKKPANLKKGNSRSKERIFTQILCEYFIINMAPGADYSNKQGFATIKDASTGGVSFLTTDSMAIDTVIKMDFLKTDISIIVEIKKHQIVNDKNFYGAKIIDFIVDDGVKYRNYIQSLANRDSYDSLGYKLY